MNAFGVDTYQNWLPQLKMLQGKGGMQQRKKVKNVYSLTLHIGRI